jgi:hypothetical protein
VIAVTAVTVCFKPACARCATGCNWVHPLKQALFLCQHQELPAIQCCTVNNGKVQCRWDRRIKVKLQLYKI